MSTRTYLTGLVAVAALALSGCSSANDVAAPAPETSPASSSAAPSTAPATQTTPAALASSSAAPTTQEPAPTTEAPAPLPTPEQTSPAPAEEAAPNPQAVAAPGTKCGTISGESIPMVAYVFGGNVSCATALEVTQEYRAQVRAGIDIRNNRDMTVENIQGYTCGSGRGLMGAVSVIGGQIGICTNAVTAGYLEIREDGERILPGFTASPYSHLFPGDSGIKVVFQTPSGQVQCQGTFSSSDDTRPITCTVAASDGGYHQASLSSTGPAAATRSSSSQAVLKDAPLDVGTSLNFMGMSCQPQSEDSVRCVNASHGFLISPAGVIQE